MNHEALSAAVLAAVIDPTMVIGEDGIIVYFNEAACQAFGLESSEAIGSNISRLMADETHATNHDQYLKNYQATGLKKMIGRNRFVTCRRCDDSSTWKASLSISEVTLDEKRYFVGTLRDVSANLARERLFSSVIDEAVDAIFTINEQGIVTLVNKNACKIFGYTEEDLIGQNIRILMPESHRAKHDQYIQNHMETGVQKMIGTDRTVTAQRKDGSQFQCRLGLSKIEDANGDGSCIFVGLLHDLTHELAARNADARAVLADKMRKQKALFLASMSHEIRTPLNGIFGMLELLRSTQLDEIQTEWLATCSRSAQSLTTILDDILLFSRADGGGITLERLSFNIRDIVEDAVMVVSHGNSGKSASERAVDLVFNVARSVPERLIGDPTRLRQVMLIFLSNALKFTSVGHVALEISLEGIDEEDSSDDDDGTDDDDDDEDSGGQPPLDGKVLLKFEVSDTGLGMSKKQVKKLFQPFTQADDSTTRQYGGTGLGLSIAKKLVALMEGDIKVESRPNRGSTFTFTSLVEIDPDSSNRACDLHDIVSEQDLQLLKGMRILSIDDNAVNTDYLVNLLKMLGCNVMAARSGVDGIELCKMAALKENPFEVLLLDYAMPTMNGLEVAELVASSQTIATTNMRIVMLGSIDVHRNIAACPHIHGFTTKPIRRQPLIRMIVEQLKLKRGILWTPRTHQPMARRDSDDVPRSPTQSSDGKKNVTNATANLTSNPQNDTTVTTTTTTTTGADTNGQYQRMGPLNILYIEDNLINQKVIVSILTRWKCQVTTALNGINGFEERVSHRGKSAFDLILCDLHMPSCDGFECVKMIRDWETKNNETPAIICAVTADANPETMAHCLSETGGFHQFLAKPLRKNVLRDMIVKICGSERLQQEEPKTGVVKRSPPRLPGAEEEKKDSSSWGGAQSSGGSGGTHVLVIDDAPTMRLLLRTLLSGMGCMVSEASSGESAVEIVKASFAEKENPDPIEMVFCDMRMPPGIGGIETSRRIKQIQGTSTLPIIGMTADDVPNSLLQEARAVGMASLISKPLGKSQITVFLAEYTGTLFVPSSPTQNITDEDTAFFDKEQALEMCGSDKHFLQNLLTDMSRDLNTRKNDLSISVQRKDCARVSEISHNIKGLAAVCSFKSLAKAACDCQKSAALSDYMEVRSKSQVVLEEIARAVQLAENFDPLAG
jgi:PAS domain S-box-containing protein